MTAQPARRDERPMGDAQWLSYMMRRLQASWRKRIGVAYNCHAAFPHNGPRCGKRDWGHAAPYNSEGGYAVPAWFEREWENECDQLGERSIFIDFWTRPMKEDV